MSTYSNSQPNPTKTTSNAISVTSFLLLNSTLKNTTWNSTQLYVFNQTGAQNKSKDRLNRKLQK